MKHEEYLALDEDAKLNYWQQLKLVEPVWECGAKPDASGYYSKKDFFAMLEEAENVAHKALKEARGRGFDDDTVRHQQRCIEELETIREKVSEDNIPLIENRFFMFGRETDDWGYSWPDFTIPVENKVCHVGYVYRNDLIKW